jgi:hypothetical protein
MPSAGFEPVIPAFNWRQTYALDRMATGFGITSDCLKQNAGWREIHLALNIQQKKGPVN